MPRNRASHPGIRRVLVNPGGEYHNFSSIVKWNIACFQPLPKLRMFTTAIFPPPPRQPRPPDTGSVRDNPGAPFPMTDDHQGPVFGCWWLVAGCFQLLPIMKLRLTH